MQIWICTLCSQAPAAIADHKQELLSILRLPPFWGLSTATHESLVLVLALTLICQLVPRRTCQMQANATTAYSEFSILICVFFKRERPLLMHHTPHCGFSRKVYWPSKSKDFSVSLPYYGHLSVDKAHSRTKFKIVAVSDLKIIINYLHNFIHNQ